MKTVKYAFLKSVPIMAGYVVLGAGFGILAVSKGYNAIWVFAMSTFIYAGSMQYVTIDLLTGGATLLASALMTLMINARHLFYGISMVDKYKDTGKMKPYLIFSLTDETYSLVCDGEIPKEINRKKYYFILSLMNQCYWIIGSIIGALVGSFIEFNSAGIEFSMTALFLVVFVEQWRSNKNHLPAIIGVGASFLCLLIFGADQFIIPSMIAITVLLTGLRKYLDTKEEAET